MQRLVEFVIRHRNFFVFLLLQVICLWLIYGNVYHGTQLFNASNYVTGKVLKAKDIVQTYFSLSSVNEQLAQDNAALRTALIREQQKNRILTEAQLDTAKMNQFQYVKAKVINNSTDRIQNYFTIDKGTNHGLDKDMGVVTREGLAGKIRACSGNFSVVTSLLHERNKIAVKIPHKDKFADAILKWDGENPREATLEFLQSDQRPKAGDPVYSSSHNQNYPDQILVGKVKFVKDDGKQVLVSVTLATDFTALSYVYVIQNKLAKEQKKLEADAINQK